MVAIFVAAPAHQLTTAMHNDASSKTTTANVCLHAPDYTAEPLRSAISNGAFRLGRALLYSAWLHKGLIVALLDCLWSVAHLLGV